MVNQSLTKNIIADQTQHINLLFLSLPNPPNKEQQSCEFHNSLLIHRQIWYLPQECQDCVFHAENTLHFSYAKRSLRCYHLTRVSLLAVKTPSATIQ